MDAGFDRPNPVVSHKSGCVKGAGVLPLEASSERKYGHRWDVGVPLAGEALGFGDLVGGHQTLNVMAVVTRTPPTRRHKSLSRRREVVPHIR